MLRCLSLLPFLLIICSAFANENTSPLPNYHDGKSGSSPSLLTRPSPINPDIPSDPKPNERIVPISGANNNGHEIKHKRESDHKNDATVSTHAPYPTLLPLGPLNTQNHGQNPSLPAHSQYKRDSQDKTGSSSVTSNPHNPSTKDNKEYSHDQNHGHSHEQNHQHKRENTKQPSTTDATKATPNKQDSSSEESHEVNKRPFIPPSQLTKITKRDTSVPATENEKEESTASTTAKADENQPSTQHPAIPNQPIPVAQLLQNKFL